MDFTNWMQSIQHRCELALDRLLPADNVAPKRLHHAMRYVALGAGKRVRPLLVHASGELVGANADDLDVAAAAVELIHVYSLVHDDLPCMDDDVLRRGKPTCHVQFDEATALLVGDALQALAFQVLAEHGAIDANRRVSMLAELSRAAGSRGMAGGQAIDLSSVGQTLTLAELEFMHIHKTGAMIRAAVMLGAQCAANGDGATLASLDRFAKITGLLFQVVDDILDAQVPTAALGKTAGKDAAQNKPTYVSLLGLVRAKEKAEELRGMAQAALSGLGDKAQRLRELTNFIVDRSF